MNEKDNGRFMEYILEFIDSNTVYKHLIENGNNYADCGNFEN